MIGPFGRQGLAATIRQHCPQMTQRRCTPLSVDVICYSYLAQVVGVLFDETTGDAQAAEAHLGLAQAAAESLLPVVAHLVLCTCSSDFKLFEATVQLFKNRGNSTVR